jgi:hypothetical protein
LTGRLVVDELRCEGGEVGEVPLEGVTTRGSGEEEAEGGGFWGFLSRRKVNLPSRELMEDMCGERPQAEEGGKKGKRKGVSDKREKEGRGSEEGGCVWGEWCRKWSGGEVRRGKNKAELEYEKREKCGGACQHRIGG